MKVYVAGSTRDVERVNKVQEYVRLCGFEITFDWTGEEGEIRRDGSWDQAPERGAEIASREIRACKESDLVIVLYPLTRGGLGCWIEMGAALASGSMVWVVNADRDSVFWQHPSVRRLESMDEVLMYLDELCEALIR